MVFRLRPLLVTALPLALLAGLLVLLREEPPPPAPPDLPGPARAWVSMDLSRAESPDQVPQWDVRRGTFRMGGEPGQRTLELQPEPMVEGKVIWTRAMRGQGGIRARMRGERARRTWPRFSVGLHQEREFHLRALPGSQKLELTACLPDLSDESILAEIDLPAWHWQEDDWIWLELLIVPDGKVYRCEGRLWKEGEARPAEPMLRHRLELPPTVFFAAVQGAPFALRPIQINAAETMP